MNKTTILVIDDEPQTRKLLEIIFESNDYRCIVAADGKSGIAMAASYQPDLILLDLGLPDKSGQFVLQELRTWFDKAIIILSVQNTEEDVVNALDNGATDYLTKPFRTAELLARIRSSLRRNIVVEQKEVLKAGDLDVDISSRIVHKGEQLVKLTSTEFNLLVLLMHNEGRVLTHQFILKSIWGVTYQNETQYLRVFIAALRKKIETHPEKPTYIITESGVGYRFVS